MNLKNGKIPKIMIDESKVNDVELYKLKEVKFLPKTIIFFV